MPIYCPFNLLPARRNRLNWNPSLEAGDSEHRGIGAYRIGHRESGIGGHRGIQVNGRSWESPRLELNLQHAVFDNLTIMLSTSSSPQTSSHVCTQVQTII